MVGSRQALREQPLVLLAAALGRLLPGPPAGCGRLARVGRDRHRQPGLELRLGHGHEVDPVQMRLDSRRRISTDDTAPGRAYGGGRAGIETATPWAETRATGGGEAPPATIPNPSGRRSSRAIGGQPFRDQVLPRAATIPLR